VEQVVLFFLIIRQSYVFVFSAGYVLLITVRVPTFKTLAKFNIDASGTGPTAERNQWIVGMINSAPYISSALIG
jgi:hypothetical protein